MVAELIQRPAFPNSACKVKPLCPAARPFLLNAFAHPLIQHISIKHLLHLGAGKTALSKTDLLSGVYILMGKGSDDMSKHIIISDGIRCCGENKTR